MRAGTKGANYNNINVCTYKKYILTFIEEINIHHNCSFVKLFLSFNDNEEDWKKKKRMKKQTKNYPIES